MIEFNLDVSGFNQSMRKSIKHIEQDTLTDIHQTLTEALHEKATDYAPKDTGKLASTSYIRYQHRFESEVVFPMPYAVYVEYGTDRMIDAHGEHDPHNPVKTWEAKRRRGGTKGTMMPYLRPAMFWVKKNFRKILGL